MPTDGAGTPAPVFSMDAGSGPSEGAPARPAQAAAERPRQAAASMYASLLEARRQLSRLAGAAADGQSSISPPPAAVLHRFHSAKDAYAGAQADSDAEDAGDRRATGHEALKELVTTLRTQLRAFSVEVDSGGGGTSGGATYSTRETSTVPGNGKVPAISAVNEAAALRQLQSKQQRLVSLLREQSTHAVTAAAVADSAMKPFRQDNDGAPGRRVRYVPCSMSICALAQDSDWPTSAQSRAEQGLESLVNAFEEIASSAFHLEAFAEHHPAVASTDGSTGTYTLTLAAKIVVIDVELALERGSVQGENGQAYWAPIIRTRISYATDSNAGVQQGALRDHCLADLLRRDLQETSSAIFGLSSTHTIAQHEVGRTVLSCFSRLYDNIAVLRRLDDLSSRHQLSEFPDFFAALQALSRTLSEIDSSSHSNEEGLGVRMHHAVSPYTSYVYRQQDGTGADLEDVNVASDDGVTGKHTLRIDIAPWPAFIHSTSDDSTLPVLTEHPSPSDSAPATRMRYTAVLVPPVALPSSMAQQLLRLCGVLSDADEPEAKQFPTQTRAVLGLESLVLLRNSSGDVVTQANAAQNKDNTDCAVLVSRFPFSSFTQLKEATALLRWQTVFNEVLAVVGFRSEVKGVFASQAGGATAQTAVGPADAGLAVNFCLDSQGQWHVDLVLTHEDASPRQQNGTNDDDGSKAQRGTPDFDAAMQHELSSMLQKQGASAVPMVLARLAAWAESVEGKDAPIVTPTEHGRASLKRRRSSSAGR